MNPTIPGPDDVQGNILKGHGRQFTGLVFFRFKDRAASAENRRLLPAAAKGIHEAIAIVSAQAQRNTTATWKANRENETAFRSLALTTHGLTACGYTRAELGISGPLASDQFWEGASPRLMGDRAGSWDEAFALMPDGVFLVAHNARAERDRQTAEAVQTLRDHYGVGDTVVEKGFRWLPYKDTDREDKNTPYEHFGFADGFANTKFAVAPGSTLENLMDPSIGAVKAKTEPFELPLKQVMIDTPGVFCGASFLVIQKLEQNVKAFLMAERELAPRLEHLPFKLRSGRAGSLFIGREPDGTPLTKTKRYARKLADLFHFGGDRDGRRCPFSAHIRKMNPRQNKLYDDPHLEARRKEQKGTQFMRRGVLYGDESRVKLAWDNPADAPEREVGLLFMGYMSQTGAQFLKMFFNWGPDADFPQSESGSDPLLGGGGQPWSWTPHPKLAEPAPVTLGQLVTSKGLAFFVVPRIDWLREQ